MRPPPSAENFGVVNPSDRILLMIDEAHRTQGSDMGDNLFEAFPERHPDGLHRHAADHRAARDKRTVKRFGEYIDTYKLMDSVRGRGDTQILYEGRTADTGSERQARIRHRSSKICFASARDEELLAIRKKYGATGDILEAENRIARHRPRSRSTLHREHSAQRLQGAGRLPFEAGGGAISEGDPGRLWTERLALRKTQGEARCQSDPAHRVPEGGGSRIRRSHQRAGRSSPTLARKRRLGTR